MEPAPDYSEEQVADELAVVMWTGVGRPLPTRKTEADIPALAAIARELATDPTLPLTRLIAEVVRQAIRRMFPENRKEAAACLLDIDVDPHKSLDELEIAPGRKPLDKHRRPDVAKHLNETWESYRRNSAVLERRLLEEVAGQLLGLVATHRRGQAPSDESNTGPAAAKPTRTDDGSEPEPTTSVEANDRRRVLVAIIGGGLTLVGVAWLAATMTGALS